MDRDIAIGNRAVANYMQEKQRKRLKERLKYIKNNRSEYSSQGFIKQRSRANSLFFEKNQQIERQNIVIFNRIASIIKKQPKINCPSSSSLQKSRQTSSIWHRKIQSSLSQENKIIQKRLFNQKPTINNKSFYQERAKNLQYLKNMAKYPYILNKKVRTETNENILEEINVNLNELPPLSTNSEQRLNPMNNQNYLKELFKHQSLDFTISVSLDLRSDLCTFNIQNNKIDQQKYSLTITKSQFVSYFEESEYDYEKMIANLRLDNEGKIYYLLKDEDKNVQISTEDFQNIKLKPESTSYTSSELKQGFKSTKKNVMERLERIERHSSTRNPKKLKFNPDSASKQQQSKQEEAQSANKFDKNRLVTEP